jgi:hypothetical protein
MEDDPQEGPARLVLEPEEPPAHVFAPCHFGLVLPGEDRDPAHQWQATRHLAARVDPHRTLDGLHAVDIHSRLQGFVQREHGEELLAQIGLPQATAAVLIRYMRQHTACVAGLEALPRTLNDRAQLAD